MGEFLEKPQPPSSNEGFFDSAIASLREAIAALRMTRPNHALLTL
jgi:hypothetical protein